MPHVNVFPRLGRLLAPALLPALLAAAPAPAETRLAMVEQPGCAWCRAWDREVGPIYPRSPEGAAAPLMRLRLGEPLPEGISFDAPVRLTPTFVLLVDGAEAGRIEGYPGDEFFWSVLARLIEAAPPSQAPKGAVDD